VTENYAGMAAINSNLVETVLSVIPIVMLVGFLINLAFARFTPLKYVFLSGHTMLAFSTLVVWLFYWFFKWRASCWCLRPACSAACTDGPCPAWVHRYAKPFVGNDFTLGHISGTSAVFSTWVGKLMGGYNKKTNPKIHDEDEDTMQFKASLRFSTIRQS
jgi:PTS system ascorbate-specific IIC component